MQSFPENLLHAFRSIARCMVLGGMVFGSVTVPSANAQISPDLPNPTSAPNPITKTLSIFSDNMQSKIINAANMMPESKYNYRPAKDVRSFGEILTHVADISYYLCSNMKGEATPAPPAAKTSKAEINAYLKASFDYCDAAYAGITDSHLNDPANSGATRRTRCSW